MRQTHLSPRMEGVYEQFERAKFFLSEARNSTAKSTRIAQLVAKFLNIQGGKPHDERFSRFRYLVASIYFARAIVELMLEAADKEEVQISRDELGQVLVNIVPRYLLIEKLRIHDFHRFGLIERPNTTLLQGPIKLKTGPKDNALAGIAVTQQGVQKMTTEGSQIIEQRPLIIKGYLVYDDEKDGYVSIDRALEEYLSAVPGAIDTLLRLRQSEQ